MHQEVFVNIPFVDLKTQYQALKKNIDDRIHKVLDHGAYINGPEVVEFEKKLSEFVGCPYALTCASGTDALMIPMMALGIGPGDEVITTAFSFIATAETIHLVGATPVYVDINPVTFNIDPKEIEKRITSKTKAIVPVSLFGQIADIDAINALAKKHGLNVIEDSAQSFGATYKGKKSGNLSLLSGTSFFPAKPLGAYGDGGAIFTSDEKLFTLMKEIREHGSEKRYYHTRLGLNGRLDTLQCAILLAKLDRYPWEFQQRQKVAQRYDQGFSGLKKAGFATPQIAAGHQSAWAQYTLRIQKRSEFQKQLQEFGIPTSVHYPMIMPEQPWYKAQLKSPSSDWSHARLASETVVSLPMSPDLAASTQDFIIEKVIKVVHQL